MTQAAKKSSRLTNAAATRLFNRFSSSGPVLNAEQRQGLERVALRMERVRCFAFAVLSKSGTELLAMANKDPETQACIFAAIREYEKHLDDLKRLVSVAQVRTSMSLCDREDMKELLERADSELIPINQPRTDVGVPGLQ